MNIDVEGLLREGMERFTADLRAPAGLMCRAARRRRRRLAVRSAAGAAAALAAASVALAAAGVPGALLGGADAATYVVNRVSSALNAAEPGEIAQVTVTARTVGIPGGTTVTTTAEEWSYGGQWRSVANSPAGRPVYDEGGTASSYTVVSYLTRTWARQHLSGRPAVPKPTPASGPRGQAASASGPRGCVDMVFQPGLPGPGLSAGLPATVASALRTAVSCGTLAVAGRQRVDGIEAIELTSRPGSQIPETIWVSPGSYLPVRVVVRSPVVVRSAVGQRVVQQPGRRVVQQPGRRVVQQTADITWLPPTAQNLAKLTVPIPAGFRQVPLAQAVKSILPQIPGGAKPQALCPSPVGPARKDRTSASGSGPQHVTHVLPASGRRSPGEVC